MQVDFHDQDSRLLYRQGLRYFVQNFRQPGVEEPNSDHNPYTIPLAGSIIPRLPKAPLGTDIHPSLVARALQDMYSQLEYDLCRLKNDTILVDPPSSLQILGYLRSEEDMPSDFWQSDLSKLLESNLIPDIKRGFFRVDTIEELRVAGRYQPYMLPHTELLKRAFGYYLSRFYDSDIAYANDPRNPYSSTVLSARLGVLPQELGCHVTYGMNSIDLPSNVREEETKLAGLEMAKNFVQCLKTLEHLEDVGTLLIRGGFFQNTSLTALLKSPVMHLAQRSKFGQDFGKESYISIRDKIVLPHIRFL